MLPPTTGLSKADRALAELVLVRGWADEAAIGRAVAAATSTAGPPDLGAVLVASGLLTAEQLKTLRDAIEGVTGRSPSPAGSGSAAERTVARSDPGATATPAGGRRMPEQIGPYRILRELGRGGMGVVFRALDPELRREVALKVMLGGPQAAESDVERFRREAAVVARMGRHPGLIQIHDIGRDGDRLYFTMDFVEGRSAKQRVEEEGAFPPREAAAIAAEVASALAFAHRAGVVHRDVKPHNILVDREGKAFLGDFGLARDLANTQGLTESGSAFGTPAYMSPEQAGGHAAKATALSDVYSLGATLYEMVTGRAPFEGESGMEVVRRVLDTDPAPPRALREGIHRDLEVIVLKAMHKVPERRYASAAEMEADLRRFLNGEPIHARPVSALEKLVTRARRHRAVVAVSAAGALLAAGIGGWAWWSLGEKDRRDRAERERRQQQALQATPKLQDGRSLLDRAERAHESGGWKDRDRYAAQAAAVLEEAARINPEDAEIHYELGRALRRAGRDDAALASLERATALNPRHSLAWYEHGAILQSRLSSLRGDLLRGRFASPANDLGFAAAGLSGGFALWEAIPAADTARLREQAARDFQMVVATGAAAERAAYGRAMLLHFEDRHDEALREVDAALAANPYSVDALRARAEILETSTRDLARGRDDRARLHRLQPYNPALALDYAESLAALDEPAAALEVLARAGERGFEDDRIAARAAAVRLQCRDAAGAAAAARPLADNPASPARDQAARLLVAVHACAGNPAGALAELERRADAIDPEFAAVLRAVACYQLGRFGDAARACRPLKPGSLARRAIAGSAAYFEWACGNLDLAAAAAEEAVGYGVEPAVRTLRGLIRSEQGDIAGALEDFEAVRAAHPALNANLSNLAGARLLAHDYAGAMEALEASVTATPMPEKQREAIRNFFKPQREAAAKAKTPQGAAKVVETLAGLLSLAGGAIADPAARAAVREGLRGLLYVLQRFYYQEGLLNEARAAAGRHLALSRLGVVLVRDACVRAQLGDAAGACAALEEAVGLGFDDGKRLDAEKAFDGIRGDAAFAAIRGRCR